MIERWHFCHRFFLLHCIAFKRLSSKKVWALTITILNILAFDFSVLFVGYSLIGNISLMFFVAQRTKRPARGAFKSLLSLLVNCFKQYNSFDTRLPLQAFLPFAGCCVIKCNLIDNACSN